MEINITIVNSSKEKSKKERKNKKEQKNKGTRPFGGYSKETIDFIEAHTTTIDSRYL